MKIHNPVRFKFLLLALILLVTFISSQLIKAARTEQYKDWAPAPGSFLKQERLKDFRTRVYYAYGKRQRLSGKRNLPQLNQQLAGCRRRGSRVVRPRGPRALLIP